MRINPKVTKEVEQSEPGPHIGAFFDFDGTVIYGYSAVSYLREQVRRGDVKLGNFAGIIRSMVKFGLGNIGFSAMMSETSDMVKGIEEDDYIEFGEELYKDHIAKLVYPEAQALIEAHLKKGHTVALISAATPYQIMPAARELGVENVLCTHLEVVDGVFTGNVVKPTCYGMGKVAAAQQMEAKYGVNPQLSYFYSDSDEDIELLDYVGNPRPLNPNTGLRKIAKGRGWPVQKFNSRGSVGIEDYVRTLAAQGSLIGSFAVGLPVYAMTGSLKEARNFSTALFADVASAIVGIDIEVSGENNLWEKRPCVFVFNHQSQADAIIMPALLRRDMAGIGKKEIGDVPIIGKIMQWGGTVLIDRSNTASALEAMRPLADIIQNEGRSFCIAPEGTRSTSTNLGRFKKGAFHLALQAEVPIVPVVIHNAIDVSPRGQFAMRPATVKVTILPAVDTSQWTAKTMNHHVEEVRDMFLVELGQMELQRPDSTTIAHSQSPQQTAKPYAKRAKKQKSIVAKKTNKKVIIKKASRKKASRKKASRKKAGKKKVSAKTATSKETSQSTKGNG